MKKKISIALVCIFFMTVQVAKADFTFGSPTDVGVPVNSGGEDFNASITADGLSLYFISNRSGGVGGRDIWVTTRETKDDPWSEPVNLGTPVNTPAGEWGVSISSDGLSLYYDTRQPGTSSAINDLWVATRATTDKNWANPVSLGPKVNSSADDYTPSISSDELELYFTSGPGRGGYGNYDLWVTMRETKFDPWGEAVNLGPRVNTSAFELDPGVSADGRALFFTVFTSDGSAGYGQTDIYVTTRATKDDPWGKPVNLGSKINSAVFEGYPNVSSDGFTMFFRYGLLDMRTGGDIWQASIEPIIDLNGNGIIDAADMCIIVDYWGTDKPLCDIGPMPWGDSIVDVEDLEVLAEHLFEEVNDPTLLTHWALDETEGMLVSDSVGDNDGYAVGDPVWQPDGGQVDGAIQLDGVDDYVITATAPNPEEGALSILAWIKGGAPGQVILSQMNGANWLCTDPSAGSLMTELTIPGRNGCSLQSQAVITDDNWHRIGFVWDGLYRALYVDGVVVAEDEQDNLWISSNGLQIGTGGLMQPGTFFSGLIDDIRIYNRVIRP